MISEHINTMISEHIKVALYVEFIYTLRFF